MWTYQARGARRGLKTLKGAQCQVEEKVGRYHLRKGVEGDSTLRVRGGGKEPSLGDATWGRSDAWETVRDWLVLHSTTFFPQFVPLRS